MPVPVKQVPVLIYLGSCFVFTLIRREYRIDENLYDMYSTYRGSIFLTVIGTNEWRPPNFVVNNFISPKRVFLGHPSDYGIISQNTQAVCDNCFGAGAPKQNSHLSQICHKNYMFLPKISATIPVKCFVGRDCTNYSPCEILLGAPVRWYCSSERYWFGLILILYDTSRSIFHYSP